MRDRPLGSSELRGYAGGALVFTVDEPYATLEEAVARTPRTSRLTRLPLDIGERAASPADSGVVLASWTETPDRGVRVEACDATVSFTPPLKPSQLVVGAGEWIAWPSTGSCAEVEPFTSHASDSHPLEAGPTLPSP